MFTKRYQLINNIGGWLVFIIALVTYWLTLEPTASYWDCGEFIIQADKLEIGHPPGNPIFMLTARFFANFASDAQSISVMVNAMSGLLSALTILLLFWTITHLVRRLTVHDGYDVEPTLRQYIAIMGSGVAGALAYCWSDTFWFSAVEGEVYAFSSFCTALVFWLILKWENRADLPHSDAYLILIAYIIGVSVAVHLLNLLCIPAIVLVFAYRKYDNMNLKKSLLALLISFIIIFFVLYGLVPGFIKVAQQFELAFVNGFGMSFNSGAIAYAIVAAALFIWSLRELDTQRSPLRIKISFICAILISGVLFIGNGVWIGIILLAALIAWLFSKYSRPLPVRVMNLVMWSISVIFIGYSSYALILIRSSTDTPMNQNSPDNVFDLASYLNREQYGENPLIYGETLFSSPMKKLKFMYSDTITVREDGTPIVLMTPSYNTIVNPGKPMYVKGVAGAEPSSEYDFLSESEKATNSKLAQRGKDFYVKRDYKPEPKMNPELNMLFPRIYSRMHRTMYETWVDLDSLPDQLVEIQAIDEISGEKVPELDTSAEPYYNQITGTFNYPEKRVFKPTFFQNLAYFFNYQLNHMYLRYFMWNFAGRQNDINNQNGEMDAGNWISGIPAIDNARLGDQSLLPDDLGKGNAGHNVYYMLPLILGLIGLIWQAFAGRRGIEQFWVVFFLFFMTGIAIVLYLNQTPNQPRERDYAFAGSFYAFAIWIGMGVTGLWRILMWIISKSQRAEEPEGDDDKSAEGEKKGDLKKKAVDTPEVYEEPLQPVSIVDEPESKRKISTICVIIAAVIGLAVPLQMVSQTWDDHDRSGRYAARDFAINYLESLEPNAIVFCNGDNDTFPLWYAQEVEGVRPDVKIINLSYLNSEWYANQARQQTYTAPPVEFTARPEDYAYGRNDVTIVGSETSPVDLLTSLKMVYAGHGKDKYGYPTFPSSVVTIPIDKELVVKRGLVAPKDTAEIVDQIVVNLGDTYAYRSKGYLGLGDILMLDIIATNAANGWKRPIYWAMTVGDEYHLGLTDYLRSTGMAHQIVPTRQQALPARTDRAYDVVRNYRWGGADVPTKNGKKVYYDETARRMIISTRSSIIDVATELMYEGDLATDAGAKETARESYEKALSTLSLISENISDAASPYSLSSALSLPQLYCELGDKKRLDRPELLKKGRDFLWQQMEKYIKYIPYHKNMAMNFISPNLTIESRYVPYQFYRFIDLYTQYGGDMKKVDQLLKKHGVTLEELEKNYNALYGQGSSDISGGGSVGESGASLESYAEEVAKYAEIANELERKSPAEYAAASEEERLVDSMLMMAVDYYLQLGGKEADLNKYPEYQKLNRERSRRLGEAFEASHPELRQ